MSLIGMTMDLLLGALLLAALFVGFRLERRLKSLRELQGGFAGAVAELDDAISRAEAGLADLKGATLEARTGLADAIQDAKSLTARLEARTGEAEKTAERVERAAQMRPRFQDHSPPPPAGEVAQRAGGGAPEHGVPAPAPSTTAWSPSPVVTGEERSARSRLDAADGYAPPPRKAGTARPGREPEQIDETPLTLRLEALSRRIRPQLDDDLFEPAARAVGGRR